MKISELVNNKRETIQNLEKEKAKLEFYCSLLSSIKTSGVLMIGLHQRQH